VTNTGFKLCAPTVCPKGKYRSGAGVNAACDKCAAGKYTDATTQTHCKSCADGKYLTKWSTDDSNDASDDCKSCQAGKYHATTGSACKECPKGKYKSSAGTNTACDQCNINGLQAFYDMSSTSFRIAKFDWHSELQLAGYKVADEPYKALPSDLKTTGHEGVGDTATFFRYSNTGLAHRIRVQTEYKLHENNFGVSMWFKTLSLHCNGWMGLFSTHYDGYLSDEYDRRLYILGGKIGAHTSHPNTPYEERFWTDTSGPTVNDGQWHQVAYSVGPSGESIYLDGDRISHRSDVTFSDNEWDWDTYIGWAPHPSDVDGYFFGSIDDVRIFEHEISSSEALQLQQGCPANLQTPDTWAPSWSSDPYVACAAWATNTYWGALSTSGTNTGTLAGSCANAWARNNCAGTCFRAM
jgi:hypothetical protein